MAAKTHHLRYSHSTSIRPVEHWNKRCERNESFTFPEEIRLDLQTVNITLRILYRPRAEVLPKIFSTLGLDYEERVLPSITNEVLKSVVVRDEGDRKARLSLLILRHNSMQSN